MTARPIPGPAPRDTDHTRGFDPTCDCDRCDAHRWRGIVRKVRLRRAVRHALPWLALAVFALLAWASVARAQMVASSETLPAMSGVVYIQRWDHPPAEFARYYAAMERCLGMRGDYPRVRWYTTPRPWTDGLHGNLPTYGLYWGPHRIIVNAPERLDSALISHEMVHDIIASNGIAQEPNGHPPAYFGVGRCAYRYHP